MSVYPEIAVARFNLSWREQGGQLTSGTQGREGTGIEVDSTGNMVRLKLDPASSIYDNRTPSTVTYKLGVDGSLVRETRWTPQSRKVVAAPCHDAAAKLIQSLANSVPRGEGTLAGKLNKIVQVLKTTAKDDRLDSLAQALAKELEKAGFKVQLRQAQTNRLDRRASRYAASNPFGTLANALSFHVPSQGMVHVGFGVYQSGDISGPDGAPQTGDLMLFALDADGNPRKSPRTRKYVFERNLTAYLSEGKPERLASEQAIAEQSEIVEELVRYFVEMRNQAKGAGVG